MIRVAHVSGSQSGEVFSSPGPVIRVGRSAGCDLRYDADREPRVSYHHAELVLEDGRWFVVDTESEHGVLVNGKRVRRQPLRPGDRIAFGAGGPEVRVEKADGSAAGEEHTSGLSAMRKQAYASLGTDPGPAPEEPEDSAEPDERGEPEEPEEPEDEPEQEEEEEEEEREPEKRKAAPPPRNGREDRNGRDVTAAKLAEEVAQKVAQQRALTGGQSSGHTMFIMADAIEAAGQEGRRRARRKWVLIVSAVAGSAVLLTSVMGVVIFRQRRQIDALANEKQSLDQQILAVQQQMSVETDEAKLQELEQVLQGLTGRAKSARDELGELGRSDSRAAELARDDTGDELDRELRVVLKNFGADVYAVPPVFKERLRYHIDWLVSRRNWKDSQERWVKYWPMIRKTFHDQGLPEELAYIAYVESQFDPMAYNDKAGARGMWQFIPTTARRYGLRVDDAKDERTDAEKGARAATKYLSALLVEFGEQSFLLALASYNMGEDRVRRVLHKVAASEAGGFRKRDFWHLYRMKLLPEETREYAPAVIAAAIVFSNPLHYGGPTLPDGAAAANAP